MLSAHLHPHLSAIIPNTNCVFCFFLPARGPENGPATIVKEAIFLSCAIQFESKKELGVVLAVALMQDGCSSDAWWETFIMVFITRNK